jgi:hypothetical protein
MMQENKNPKSWKLETVLGEADRFRLQQVFIHARNFLLLHKMEGEAELVRRLGESFEGDMELRNGPEMYEVMGG